MIVMDSSGWVEIVGGGPREAAFVEQLQAADAVAVPSLVLYEVYRVIERQFGEIEAEKIASYLRGHSAVDLDAVIAISAAKLGKKYRLAMGDAVVYATAREMGATLVTGDVHFADLSDVVYIPMNIDQN